MLYALSLLVSLEEYVMVFAKKRNIQRNMLYYNIRQ